MIDVCLLGTSGMMPLPGRPLSSVAFRIGAEAFLIDAGEGTQVSWRNADFTFNSCGTILISHLHYDHVGGLPGVLFQIGLSGRSEPLTIYGPEQTGRIVKSLLSIVGRLPFGIDVVELTGGAQVELPEGASLAAIALSHRVPCLGYVISRPRLPRFLPERARELGIPVQHWKRLQKGEQVHGVDPELVTGPPRPGLQLSFITDTRYSEEIIRFVRGSDLLICEAMYADDDDATRAWERGHMTIRQACRLAREAEVGELWLTHFSPKVADPRQHTAFSQSLFERTVVGFEGLSTTLTFPED